VHRFAAHGALLHLLQSTANTGIGSPSINVPLTLFGRCEAKLTFDIKNGCMTKNIFEVPSWLLDDLFLADGVFNEARTAVIGHPTAHLRAVLDTGNGTPPVVTLPLTEDQKRRLYQAGGNAEPN